jgi:hypothetical protein
MPPGSAFHWILRLSKNFACDDAIWKGTEVGRRCFAHRCRHFSMARADLGEQPKVGGVQRTNVVGAWQKRMHRSISCAANVILACFNQVIPFLVPTLPEEQRIALHYASKVPMQISNALVRNWLPLRRLGVSSIHAPNGYHQEIMLDTPLSIGGYESVRDGAQPAVLGLKPG